jgi:hypothetical protein
LPQSIDYLSLARTSLRERFIANHPHPFLVAARALEEHEGPIPTLAVVDFGAITARKKPRADETGAFRTIAPPSTAAVAFASLGAVRAVVKTQLNFPSMITVGRTANNDVVIPDVTVSKFHAYFRAAGNQRFELCDAGSRNGTFVQGRPLVKRGPGVLVTPGDTIRVGHVEMQLVDAGICWDLANRRKKQSAASDW